MVLVPTPDNAESSGLVKPDSLRIDSNIDAQ